MYNNSPNIYHPWPYKATPLFKFKNRVVPLFLPCANHYQQKIPGHYTNYSKQNITTSLPFSFHQTHILNLSQHKNYETFSRALRVHLVKNNTISSSKALKLHVKLITYINSNNVFNILISVVFDMSSQLGVLGTKSQELAISFCIAEVETLP